MNVFSLKTIEEAAAKGHEDQVRKVREWGDKKLADKMEKMTIKVIKL